MDLSFWIPFIATLLLFVCGILLIFSPKLIRFKIFKQKVKEETNKKKNALYRLSGFVIIIVSFLIVFFYLYDHKELGNIYSAYYFNKSLRTESDSLAFEYAENAFMVWGNNGNSEAILKASNKVSYDSRIWVTIIHDIGRSNYNSKCTDKTIPFFLDLLPRLKHPDAYAACAFEIGQNRLSNNDYKNARQYFQNALELNPSEWYKRRLKSFIYECDSLQIGQKAPLFVKKDIHGNLIDISKLKGKVVLLEFWATDCGWCYYEMSYYRKLFNLYKDEEFQMIGIALDKDQQELEKIIQKEKLLWTQIMLPEKFEAELVQHYNIFGIPWCFLIDRNGIIVGKNLRGDELIKAVEKQMNSI